MGDSCDSFRIIVGQKKLKCHLLKPYSLPDDVNLKVFQGHTIFKFMKNKERGC